MDQRQTWISSPWVLWGLWVLVFAAVSAWMPRDVSYDVAHYHIHNGWSILSGRLDKDLAPAEMHSFLNPAYNAGAFWLMQRLPGPLVSAILSVPQALIFPALYYLTSNITRACGRVQPVWLVAVIAFTGFLSEPLLQLVASVRNDTWGALAFIAGLALILPRGGQRPNWKRLALASGLVGFITGLKLTNGVYTVGFAIAVIIALPGLSARLKGVGISAISGLAGVLVGGGAWALVLWQRFGNPVFPMMNGLFKSPDGTHESFRDVRYLPESIFEGVIRPFQFMFDGKLITEEPFRDFRFQLGYIAAFLIVGFVLARARRGGGEGSRQVLALAIGVLVMIFTWTFMFSIQRYAMAAWLLGPTLMLAAVCYIAPTNILENKWTRYGLLGVCAGLISSLQMSPLRRAHWENPGAPYIVASAPADMNFEDSIILFSGGWPSAFAAIAFPESATLTHAAVQDWSAKALENYQPRIQELIWQSGKARPLYAVLYDGEGGGYTRLVASRLSENYELRLEESECRALTTSFDIDGVGWQVCPLQRLREAGS